MMEFGVDFVGLDTIEIDSHSTFVAAPILHILSSRES